MDVFTQQPNEVLDYDVDMAAWFESVPGDDIESVRITITSPSEEEPTLVAGPGVHPEHVIMGSDPTRFKVWIGGGTDRVDYIVTCVVLTEQDRTKEVEFKIKVRDK